MARLVYGMNQSLDGYVDGVSGNLELGPPDAGLFRHFVERARTLAGSLYGRRVYELMQYWDEDRPEWTADERDFAEAWRKLPKWVVSRTLTKVGPNATLVGDDVGGFVRRLKADVEGDIEVGGPVLAGSLTELGLVDVYDLYLQPLVLGRGKPYFAGPRPPLRLVASERIGSVVIRLSYVPATTT
jgi:dihydrofolate reductase